MITLKTLHLATKEEVFEQVKTHLLTQRKKSITDFGECLYKFETLKCAAGCLIGDDEYKSEIEDRTWHVLVKEKRVPNYHENLIRKLQRIHDDKEVEQWEEELNKIDLNDY